MKALLALGAAAGLALAAIGCGTDVGIVDKLAESLRWITGTVCGHFPELATRHVSEQDTRARSRL